jgi:hypothetical protein
MVGPAAIDASIHRTKTNPLDRKLRQSIDEHAAELRRSDDFLPRQNWHAVFGRTKS